MVLLLIIEYILRSQLETTEGIFFDILLDASKGLQVAPQETEVESYIVGGIKQDVKKDTFSGFKL